MTPPGRGHLRFKAQATDDLLRRSIFALLGGDWRAGAPAQKEPTMNLVQDFFYLAVAVCRGAAIGFERQCGNGWVASTSTLVAGPRARR